MSQVKRLSIGDYSWEDERGWGLNLLALSGLVERPVGDLHIVSVKPGAVRGNHRHDRPDPLLR